MTTSPKGHVFTVMAYMGEEFVGTLTTRSWGMAVGFINGYRLAEGISRESITATLFIDGKALSDEELQEHIDLFRKQVMTVSGFDFP